MTSMILRYEPTGEVRPPRAGEWFKNSRGHWERARFTFSAQSFEIGKEVLEPADPPTPNQPPRGEGEA